MPEMPEVESLARFLTEKCVGHAIDRIDLLAFSALKTYDPPLSALTAWKSSRSRGAGSSSTYRPKGCTWSSISPGQVGCAGETLSRMRRPGRVGVRWLCAYGWTTASGFELTEAGTQRKLAVYVVADPDVHSDGRDARPGSAYR